MKNELRKQAEEFLNGLCFEDTAGEIAIDIPGHKEMQDELEGMREECEEMIYGLPMQEKRMLLEWMEKLEDMNSLEGKKAYCQGYIDCILLLRGTGLLRQDLSPDEFMKRL